MSSSSPQPGAAAAAAAAPSQQPPEQFRKVLRLPGPLSGNEVFDTERAIVVIANDGVTKFLASKNGLVRFSKLYRALSQASDIEELPLRCNAASPEITALVCAWINHYAEEGGVSEMPSRVAYPLQPGTSLSCFLSNDYDVQFVEQLLFRETGRIAGSCGRLYGLAITAAFLQCQILVELCSGVFAFHIREAELGSRPVQAPSGESVVRSWFGLSGEFSQQERSLILEQNRDLRDPMGVLEKIREMSEESHSTAAALAENGVPSAVGSG